MKVTKQIILDKATELFNAEGYANVSYRKLARALDISHSNLIYHFKDKNTLVEALHDQILNSALAINAEIKQEQDLLKSLLTSTLKGFEVLFNFRFFMIDFNYILRDNKKLHHTIVQIESLRFSMYEERINTMIEAGIVRASQYNGEYDDLIKRIRVYSDYWISSSYIYDAQPQAEIKEYARIFMGSFYPYLTSTGRAQFDHLIKEYGW